MEERGIERREIKVRAGEETRKERLEREKKKKVVGEME